MRPSNPASLEAAGHSRKLSNEGLPAPAGNASSGGPTTFFLASESELARRSSNAGTTVHHDTTSFTPSRDVRMGRPDGKVVQQTLASQIRPIAHRRSTIRPHSREDPREESGGRLPNAQTQQLLHCVASSDLSAGCLTPSLPPSLGSSIPGSPKSLSPRSTAKTDDGLSNDAASSQAIESSDDEDSQEPGLGVSSTQSLDGSAPQLIMPSIRMPSRRPFTDRGKQMGKFKVMVVGSKGVGKTSLIKSIVQICEDIVHVDPLSSTNVPTSLTRSRVYQEAFTETFASTRSYPSWWSELDESRVLKRRKSVGDQVLERNICFVDTCHSRSPSFASTYLEQQLHQTITCAAHASSDITSLLSGRGGSQVDVILYLISYDFLDKDIEHIRQLTPLANIIPLIAKSDLLTSDQVAFIRSATSDLPCPAPSLPLTFQSLNNTDSSIILARSPYTVSCVNGPDYDNMDASLLMSSEYVQPLVGSELGVLIDQLFSPDNMAYFRHTASVKLVNWYHSGSRLTETLRTPSPASARHNSPQPSTLHSPIPIASDASGVLHPVISHTDLSLNTSNSFALARVSDHTSKEERLAHIRLSKWASDLQLSLQRERERYESLARSERAIWLIDRMGQEIKDGRLVPVSDKNSDNSKRSARQLQKLYSDGGRSVTYQTHDPLGLLRWHDAVRAHTWLALQIVGSFGVVGGMALWIAKQWGYDTTFHQWARDWGVWHD